MQVEVILMLGIARQGLRCWVCCLSVWMACGVSRTAACAQLQGFEVGDVI
jgi:hypothetical protein